MQTLIQRYATPLTTGLFTVSTISGLALFFHWAPGTFHAMHEWLSVLLLAPFAFHFARNWRSLAAYAKRRTLILPMLACFAIAVPFAVAGLGTSGGGNPASRAVAVMTNAPLADIAPLLKTTPDALLATLRAKGIATADATPSATLTMLADAADESVMAVLATVLNTP